MYRVHAVWGSHLLAPIPLSTLSVVEELMVGIFVHAVLITNESIIYSVALHWSDGVVIYVL